VVKGKKFPGAVLYAKCIEVLPQSAATAVIRIVMGKQLPSRSPRVIPMLRHFVALIAMSLCLVGHALGEDAPRTVDQAVTWLQNRSTQMIHDCRHPTKSGITAFPPQVGAGYDAFWLRDYAYMLEGNADAFSDAEVTNAYRYFLGGQRSDGAMVDCIKFDGIPVYMPGGGTLGRNPVADGSQFAVDVAWHTFQKTHDKRLIAQTVDKLITAMNAVPRNPANGLVRIRPGTEIDRCPYGFTDTVHKQGDELFCSLLFVQASRQLGELLNAVGRPDEAKTWNTESLRVTRSINQVFWGAKTGLYLAATDVCRQPDIWGSAFAVSIGVADSQRAQAVAAYFDRHYSELVKRGQLRHLPAGMVWESTSTSPGTYQNGAYWATPIGWFVQTLDRVNPKLADQTVVDLVNDFIATHDENECVNDGYAHVSHYLVSATLPLAGIRAMQAARAPHHKSTSNQ
jgi:glycogen debranching enzyme